jgi:signal peptide peptidase SppA
VSKSEREQWRLRAVREIREEGWAMRPWDLAKFARLLLTSDLEAGGDRPRIAAATRSGGGAGSIAVLPVMGPITPRATFFSLFFGGTSIEEFRAMFRQALGDPNVGAIVLDVDSPGGLVDQIPEMAAEIRAGRNRKPVVAVADTDAASGAYWLASQASEFFVTPSGEVGSIGVYTIHEDESVFDHNLGITVTLISAGKYKVEANPFEPLTDEARQALQDKVDAYYDMFVSDVAAGRGVAKQAVLDGFGQGRMVMAKPATSERMTDRVGTLEDAIRRASQLARGGVPAAAAADPTPAHMAEPFGLVEGAERLLRYPAVREAFRETLN